MAFRSPYRDEPKKPPSALGRWASRAVMFAVGCVLTYFGIRGLLAIQQMYIHEPPQVFYTNAWGRLRINWFVLLAPLAMVVLTLIGTTMAVASAFSVDTLQSLFERWYRPPTTGERGGDDLPFGRRRWWR